MLTESWAKGAFSVCGTKSHILRGLNTTMKDLNILLETLGTHENILNNRTFNTLDLDFGRIS